MSDYLKFKLALSRTRRDQRFTVYDISDFTRTEDIGLVASKHDFDIGTPNLNRPENVFLVASSSSSKESIVVDIKWRPHEAESLVTQINRFTLITEDGVVLKHESTETYQPATSNVHPGRYMQYGSSGSGFKLIISSPYRRTRFVFRGQMQQLGSEELVFVKLNVVISSTGKIFDFDQQFDPECFKKNYHNSKLQHLGYEAAINKLLYHDRHEQMKRLCGDLLIEPKDKSQRVKKSLMLWGFEAREFVAVSNKDNADCTHVKSYKRIFGSADAGHAFHIGQCKFGDDSLDFGYTCFEILPITYPIDNPFEGLDWSSLDEETKDWSVKVKGQNRELQFSGKRRQEETDFYDVVMEESRKGWAYVMIDDGDRSKELELVKESQTKYLAERKNRDLCVPIKFTGDERPLMVDIEDKASLCNDLVGAKASSLAELNSFAGKSTVDYEVPHAFMLTRFAHDLFVESSDKLKEAVAKLNDYVSSSDDMSNLQKECESVQFVVEQSELPQQIKQQVSQKLSEKHGHQLDQVPFAVRSSSWGEDEEDMSAAGQLTTLLNVRGLDAIYVAIVKCFASKFSYENIEYKRQHGLPLNLPMAVVIQQMVECDKAGVMFTCEPATGNGSVITITANYGLGESVVSGQSDPDSIKVSNNLSNSPDAFNIEEVQVGQKRIVLGQAEYNNHDKSKCCLSDEEILRLAKLGRLIERYFRCARDIEWGFQGGKLYLFQSRPVTGLDTYSEEELMHELDSPTRSEIDFFTRANIGEVMARAFSPLSAIYRSRLWELFSYRIRTSLLGQKKMSPNLQTSMFGVYDSYHMFFNLKSSSILDVTQKDGKKSLSARMMEIALFGHEVEPIPELNEVSKQLNPSPQLFMGKRYKLMSLPLRVFTFQIIMRDKRNKPHLRQLIKDCKLTGGLYEADYSMRALLEQLRQLPAYQYISWHNHIVVVALANEANGALQTVLSKYIEDPIHLSAAMTKFLGASPNVISAEIPERIASMAKIILSKESEERERILALNNERFVEFLESGQDIELTRQFEEFLVRFGHRCYNEFEISEVPWREDKTPIIDMLRSNCVQADVKKETFTSSNTLGLENKPTNEEILESLKLDGLTGKDRTNILKSLVPRCQLFVAAREQTKDCLIEQIDLQREASRMLAKEMKRQLRIPDENLMYFILFDEFEALIRDHQPSIVMQALRRRQLHKRHFSEVWKFDEIIRGPKIVPNHLKPSRELDDAISNAPKLHGTPASSGRVRGKVCLVEGYAQLHKVRPGSILLTHSTDIGFSPVFPMISGIITEVGGLISHGAVVAREYGLPSLLGIPEVTRILQDGEEIILDADNGVIIRLAKGGDDEGTSETIRGNGH